MYAIQGYDNVANRPPNDGIGIVKLTKVIHTNKNEKRFAVLELFKTSFEFLIKSQTIIFK